MDGKDYFHGTTLNDFELLRHLGSGSYGDVTLAVRKDDLNTYVALKQIKVDPDVRGFPIEAKREISILGQINFPYIIHMNEVVLADTHKPLNEIEAQYDGEVYISMEYAPTTLQREIEAGTLSENYTKQIMKQILVALTYLHNKGILHRDIKGSNILLDHYGNVKIADFGLSRMMEPKMTKNRGTFYYSSPEMMDASYQYDGKTDVFSAGIVFAELLTGDLIFKARSKAERFAEIYDFELKGQNILWRLGCSAEASELLIIMLSFSPRHRVTAKQALSAAFFC